MDDVLHHLRDYLPEVVFRKHLKRDTCGLLNSRTQANKDSLGTGIPGAQKFGRDVVYPKEAVLAYIAANFKPCAPSSPSSPTRATCSSEQVIGPQTNACSDAMPDEHSIAPNGVNATAPIN